ncbi:MAG TPA: GDSL-type esterase/lipase family protein [Mycobacteriales bacterium]|nr:GDSL-type esterase/lipase family protein [Mycobacteriales bacterium]
MMGFTRRRGAVRLGAYLGGLGVLAGTAVLGGGVAVAATPGGPTAIVSMGDSAISGEGAGDYQAGTDGPVDFCHRSVHAEINRAVIPGVVRAINLACSGAASANVRIGGASHYTEPSQVDQLRAVAAHNDVKMIVLQLGANDDPAFSSVVLACVQAWANPFATGCRGSVGPSWPGRVAAAEPKVAASIGDIRAVMRAEGYADADYAFVLQSYASPVTEHMNRLLHAVQGCPVRIDDANWGRTVAVPELAAGLRAVAERTGVRFLDLSRATENHEACNSDGLAHWQNPLVIDVSKIPAGLNLHVVQQSFHPNAAGHGQFGRCLAEFYADGAAQARCVAGADGNLHARVTAVTASG